MARHGFNIIMALGLTAIAGTFALLTGCATYAHTRTVVVEKPAAAQIENDDRQADEFIGTPIMGDYDNDENLDFVLEVNDGTKVFKLEVHETAGGGNRELLENVRQHVNAMEDAGSIRVIGYYSTEYRGSTKEYGFLDLKMIAFYDEATGKEEAYFTDPQDSQFYTDSDVTVIYAPGHHYSNVYYPRYVSPWWDTDGDGIPNRYDAWPLSYDTWYDYNMNYIPDWYDPYYRGYYPYWSHWDMNFWVGYHWYSPGYYSRGYTCHNYYNDYRTYTRLYDRRVINNRDNSGRRLERLDAKSDRVWRESYNRDAEQRTRVASDGPGNRNYRGYEDRTPDNRVLSDPSLRSRSRTTDANTSDRTRVSSSGDNDTFTRNRVVSSDNTADNTRSRRVTTGTEKTRTSTTVTDRSRDRASVSSSARTATATSTRERSARTTTTTNRVYRPTNSRSREVTSGRTTTSSSSTRVYTPSSRSRSSSTPATTRSSSRSRSSGSTPAASSSSSRSRSAPAARSSSSSSRSRSSAPAARSSSSSSRSSGSARSSSSSSRSRSSGSSSSSSSRKRN